MFVFNVTMASLHLLTFIISFVSNFVASDCASAISKVRVDRKSRLFRRLTVLQCRIALFHNLWRIPLMARLFHWDWRPTFIQEVCTTKRQQSAAKFRIFFLRVSSMKSRVFSFKIETFQIKKMAFIPDLYLFSSVSSKRDFVSSMSEWISIS